LQLEPVVECGGRFVLDPRSKHQPTLLSRDGAELREAFLRRALEAALDLGAGGISMWSGANVNGLEEQPAWKRLTASVGRLLDEADRLGLWIAFEPEPGMFVETVEGFHRLNEALGDPQHFGLSLDLGHLLVTGEGEPADVLLREREYLLAVAIEDMRRGVHEHLPFGEGDLDLGRTLEALGSSGFQGIVAVELPRHAHDAVEQARQAAGILRAHGVPFRSRAPTGQDGPAPASQ
jgi:sugar phosphate isomerase/epimerase